MKRPLAYITAAWFGGDSENAELAAQYCRAVYEAGFAPICPALYLPLFLNDAVPEEHKSGIDIGRDLLRRSRVLVVCGHSMTEAMKQDYMVLAKSKGTSPIKLIVKHALKNCLIPVVTYAGPLVAYLMTGSFVIESIFSIPGLGGEFVTSVTNRDYPLIMALTIFFGAFIIFTNLVSDLLTAMIDPRIKLEKRKAA